MPHDVTQKILERLSSLEKRVRRGEKMEFGTAASLTAAGFAKTGDIPTYPVFAGSTVTQGYEQGRVTTGAYAYQEQGIVVWRPIKLDAILWDIRTADNYALTVRDYEGNVLFTINKNVPSNNSIGVEFAISEILLSGRYKLRVTKASGTTELYEANTNADKLHSCFDIAGDSSRGETATSYRAALRVRFYPQVG